ncbi:hypothetical protein RAB80_015622 [Fusarium oxysporum f. sp. vasinfectum]|nr:hypothetical protein RAB80_015622 [Fusarium oxysporum f. sp. vasinfectum]
MKASIIITTILTTSAWAGNLPTKRQNAANEAALQQAREDSAKAIEGGQGRGRLLLDEGNCSEASAGFVFCEASVITNLNEKEETCLKE